MTLAKAVSLLIENYDRAQNMDHIQNPVAWALYKVWEKADKEQPVKR